MIRVNRNGLTGNCYEELGIDADALAHVPQTEHLHICSRQTQFLQACQVGQLTQRFVRGRSNCLWPTTYCKRTLVPYCGVV